MRGGTPANMAEGARFFRDGTFLLATDLRRGRLLRRVDDSWRSYALFCFLAFSTFPLTPLLLPLIDKRRGRGYGERRSGEDSSSSSSSSSGGGGSGGSDDPADYVPSSYRPLRRRALRRLRAAKAAASSGDEGSGSGSGDGGDDDDRSGGRGRAVDTLRAVALRRGRDDRPPPQKVLAAIVEAQQRTRPDPEPFLDALAGESSLEYPHPNTTPQ